MPVPDTTVPFVSIHAPARGATWSRHQFGRVVVVSIHAPARGATHDTGYIFIICSSFNPRTREGCDAIQIERELGIAVSIHAPARGATII